MMYSTKMSGSRCRATLRRTTRGSTSRSGLGAASVEDMAARGPGGMVVLPEGDGPPRAAVATPDLHRGEQEIGPAGDLRQVRPIFHPGHPRAAEGPVRHQRPLRIDTAEARGVGRHAADGPSREISDRARPRGRPALALSVQGVVQARLPVGRGAVEAVAPA